MNGWWKYLECLHTDSDESIDAAWATAGLGRAALEGGSALRWSSPSGVLRGPLADLLAQLRALDGRLVYERIPSVEYGNLGFIYAWDDAMVCVWAERGDDWVSMQIASADEALMGKLMELVAQRFTPRAESHRLYALAASRSGLSLQHVGAGGSALERGNYDATVIEGFDHILADLADANPCGRLVVFEGEPGTGKTFLVRALLHSLQRALCVLVPPHLIPRLMSPEMIHALTNTRDTNEHQGPVVLVLEEADGCLVPRQSDNMGEMGTLLNFTDGILGRVLDLRIIATTNARRVDMDKALLRPGRLCRRVEVSALRAAQAHEILTRLGASGDLDDDRRYTLAEIYERAQVAAGR